MKGILNQEDYDNYQRLIDIVGLHKTKFRRVEIVSFLELGSKYDGKKVKNEKAAEKFLEKCLEEGEELLRLEDNVKIDWEKFAWYDSTKKGEPRYIIGLTPEADAELPQIPSEYQK